MSTEVKAIEWTYALSVGVKVIDDEHKFLLSILNDLVRSLEESNQKPIIMRAIEELVGFTNYHFGHEEELMITFGYPDYEPHKRLHTNFVAKLLEFEKDVAGGARSLPGLATFVHDFVLGHFMRTDQELGAFLKTRMPPGQAFDFNHDATLGVLP
ncbi:putative Bacteriohemerythrin [uncultured Gammaproteobacteria bacterium]